MRPDPVRTRVDAVRSRVDGARMRVDAVRSRVDGARMRVDGARTRVDGVRTRADGARTRVDGARTRVDGARTRADGARTRVDGARMRADGARTRVDRVRTRADRVSSSQARRERRLGPKRFMPVMWVTVRVAVGKVVPFIRPSATFSPQAGRRATYCAAASEGLSFAHHCRRRASCARSEAVKKSRHGVEDRQSCLSVLPTTVPARVFRAAPDRPVSLYASRDRQDCLSSTSSAARRRRISRWDGRRILRSFAALRMTVVGPRS